MGGDQAMSIASTIQDDISDITHIIISKGIVINEQTQRITKRGKQ